MSRPVSAVVSDMLCSCQLALPGEFIEAVANRMKAFDIDEY